MTRILTKTALKITFAIIITSLVLSSFYYGYFALQDWRKKHWEDKVEMTVRYDTKVCEDNSYPLAVTIKNHSSGTIKVVYFNITVRLIGYSDNLNDLWRYKSDKIIKPEEAHTSCWQYKLRSNKKQYNDPRYLEFEIRDKRVNFF